MNSQFDLVLDDPRRPLYDIVWHREHRLTLDQRVVYLNRLRVVVGRGVRKNAAGVPLVSDFDLLHATISEREEALNSI